MSDDTYNGWTNRETWAIQLHLSNNEGDYNAIRERAAEIVGEMHDPAENVHDRPGAVSDMADYTKGWTEEVFDSVVNPPDSDYPPAPTQEARLFVSDVGSWWRADFYEIAEHWIDEALESVDA